MNQRKLIKLGNSSFAIALPKDWVDKSGLKKGDHVFITPNSGGELIVQSAYKGPNGDKKISINIEGKDPLTLKRELTSHYINGYTLISINGKRNREVNDVIKKSFKNLVGMEIIKNEAEEMIAKDLFNIEESNMNNFVRRVDNNLREMFGTLISGFEKKKISQSCVSDIFEADEDVNKFHILISRILSIGMDNPSVLTKLKTSGLQLMDNWWLSFNLEHIGDEVKSVSRIVKNEKLNEDEHKKISDLFSRLSYLHNNSMEFFYSEKIDEDKALKLSSEGKKIWSEFDKLTLSKNSTVAKIAMKLKAVETFIYQNLKMILNNRV